MCSGSEAGSYLRLIDSCISKIKAQGPSRTCNESKEEYREHREVGAHRLHDPPLLRGGLVFKAHRLFVSLESNNKEEEVIHPCMVLSGLGFRL